MNPELEPEDRRFADAAVRALRESERRLDTATAGRLAAARARALEAAGRRPAAGWWLPAGALAAGLLVLLALPPRTPPAASVDLAEAEALEVLTDEWDPEFYRDLEFYEWLDGANDRA